MMDKTAPAEELLPPLLQQFVRLIGLPATLRFVEQYGGVRVYIPAEATAEHPFAELIGLDNLRALCAEFSQDGHGLRYPMPKATAALTAVRNARIREEYKHRTARELALIYRLTERSVERIVAGAEQASDLQAQLDL